MKEKDIAEIYHSKLPSSADVSDGPELDQGDGVLAGEDDRKDVYELGDDDLEELQKKLVNSTVILTDKSNLVKNADGDYELQVEPFRRLNQHGQSIPPCRNEKFGNQHTGGWCSGFMVGPDIIATAGHCGKTLDDIQDTVYVFGFRVKSEADPGTTQFAENQVYFGSDLLAHDLSETGDFAIVRVDRMITAPGAVSLPLRRSGSPFIGQNLGVIGHPSGLPVKIAFGVDTRLMRAEDPWLIANLDTYGGNSGSAVFNNDGVVEGILVRGAQDYNLNSDDNCFVSNRIANANGSEAVTKSEAFVAHVPELEETS